MQIYYTEIQTNQGIRSFIFDGDDEFNALAFAKTIAAWFNGSVFVCDEFKVAGGVYELVDF